MSARAWRALVGKELRVLGPVWVGTLALMALAVVADGREGYQIAGPAYVVGALALGALAVGQEYGHRTLASLLMQPVARRTLLAAKLLVLGVLLVALCAGALLLLRAVPLMQVSVQEIAGRLRVRPAQVAPNPAWLVLPLLYGLCVAPWMTMVSRGVLAGVVLTGALPATAWLMFDVALWATSGFGQVPPEIDLLRLRAVWFGSLAVCGAGAFLTWRLFPRLQAIEGARELRLPASATTWLSARVRPASGRRPVWLLLALKEIRLHQMAFAVAGLYVLVCAAILPLRPVAPDLVARLASVVSLTYAAAVAVLIGAFASAEERHLGTHRWQMLLPVSIRRQWIAKVLVAAALLGVLGLALPRLLVPLLTGEIWARHAVEPVVVLTLMIVALYVSTLSSNGLRALVTVVLLGVAVPVALAVLQPLVRPLSNTIARAAAAAAHEVLNAWWPQGVGVQGLIPLDHIRTLFLTAGLAVLLWFGLLNHRTDDRSARLRAQVVALAGALLFAVCLDASMRGMRREAWLHTQYMAKSPDSHIAKPGR
jgi:hypothetical protein